MPRGRRRRMVWREPGFCRFRPMGMQGYETVTLSVDEFEAIRLNDLEEMGQKVGSSRVDLQACKLEYSIVSPK